MFKIIIWSLIIWIFWFMIRNYLTKQSRRKNPKPALPQKMVKCHQCAVHTPEAEAFFHDSHWFCKQAHMQAYLLRKTDSDK